MYRHRSFPSSPLTDLLLAKWDAHASVFVGDTGADELERAPVPLLPRCLLVAQLPASLEGHLSVALQVDTITFLTSLIVARQAVHRDQTATIMLNHDPDARLLKVLPFNAPHLEREALMLIDMASPVVDATIAPLVADGLPGVADGFEATLATTMVHMHVTLEEH